MSDDLGDRADDYERRLAAAGSTDDIIGGLVRAATRNRRSVRLLAISLAVDIILSLGMATLAAIAWNNTSRIAANSANIQRNVHIQCLAQNRAAVGTNTVLDVLIKFSRTSPVLTPAERADRVRVYIAVKIPVLKC